MDRIKYEQGRGVRRGDQVGIWMKVMPFWLVTIGWLVRQVRRRGVVVWVVWNQYSSSPAHKSSCIQVHLIL